LANNNPKLGGPSRFATRSTVAVTQSIVVEDSQVVQSGDRAPTAEQLARARAGAVAFFEDRLPVDHDPTVTLAALGTLLSDLATVAKNRILPTTKQPVTFDLITTPTRLQQHAFDLLGVNYRM
jgi:hypothetical protein